MTTRTPFKEELGAAAAERLADELVRAWPAFPRPTLVDGLAAALAPLELTARSTHLAERLQAAFPSFDQGAATLRQALQSPTFDGWITLPCGRWVAAAGIDRPDEALSLLAALTPRFSSEWAMRPLLERHPDRTYTTLHAWIDSPDEHVRRLVSECTRPRLPWASVLRGAIADPAPNVALLDRLVGDPSAYVRRSVANHLGDIGKDHPDLAVDIARRWLAAGDHGWVVRHGLRTLVKRAHPGALALLGADPGIDVRLVAFEVAPRSVAVGERVHVSVALALADEAAEPAEAEIDYRVHYVGARGVKAPKVFKLARRTLIPGEPVAVARHHRFDHVSIRRILPGPHVVDVQVNGRVLGAVTVDVRDDAQEATVTATE